MKKLLCAVLCLALMAASCVFVFAAEPDSEQLSVLYNYGIFRGDENGDLNLDKNITRAEFCKVILTALGYSDGELNKITDAEDFPDVDSEYWAYLYIKSARRLSFIDGYEDGNFLPENDITLNEVIKIVVNALGYAPKAEQAGGYPGGYSSVAKDLGLTKNIAVSLDESALRGDVASIIYTALDIPVMQVVGFGEQMEYKVMDGSEDIPLITWKTLRNEEHSDNTETEKTEEDTSDVPRFNGPEYTGIVLKIADLKETADGYTFKNSLDDSDDSTYVINSDTYVYLSSNTVELSEIKADMYAQCWYLTEDTGDIEILKIELMEKEPAGI